MVLSCWCFGLELVAAGSTVVCAVVLKVGSSALVAQLCLLPNYFNLSDTWCIWGIELALQ